MTTIAYDRPVKDLVDALSKTGHVTHKAFRKNSVTFHHNAGRLSHEGVLRVWQKRPASAHFDVDRAGDVAQYVKINEYAWAVGNTEGNRTSISIEMANETLGPEWRVAEATWKSAARLGGWIFAKVIGERPTRDNVFYHHHWKSTTCAGPYMDSVYDQLLAEVQRWYDHFTGGTSTPSSPAQPAATPRKSLTTIAAEVWAGKWGNGADRERRLRDAGYDPNTVQALVNRGVGNNGNRKAPVRIKSVGELASEAIQGKWGNGKERYRRLRDAGFNADAVQAEVNRRLLGGSRRSLTGVAREVIDGKWGNGTERKDRLRRAGYDYNAVQSLVNRMLR